jgi:D-alanine--poly(phosphoribitol) ligase subunit 1
MIVGFLGTVISGRGYIPMDVTLPQARLERIVDIAQPAAVLDVENIRALTNGWETVTARELAPNGEGDAFYIMFTSGSTGDPKGVVITHANLASFVDWMLAEHPFVRGAETFFNQVPLSFDVSVMDTYLGLLTGGTVVYSTREDVANPRNLYAKLRESGTTVWVSTPSFAQMCLVEKSFNQEMLPHLRRFLFCGETLAHKTASTLLQRFPGAEIWNTYGPTEATVATTAVRVTEDLLAKHNPLPIGYEMRGTSVVVKRPDGSIAGDGEFGEIVIYGPNVSPGYLKRPDLTGKAFLNEPARRGYRTGDKGYAKDGLLFFCGRLDFQVKVRGHRIELGDVEAHIREAPGVIDAVVLPVERNGVCESLAAFVVMREPVAGNDFNAARALRENVAERIPEYMVPRKVVFLESFPMNANGKADRKGLAARLV